MDDDEKQETLFAVARAIADDDDERAQDALDRLMDALEDEGPNADVRFYVFGAALAKRMAGGEDDAMNIYLQSYDVPQIKLFSLLAKHFHIIHQADSIANHMLHRATAGLDRYTLVDIGTGLGHQLLLYLLFLKDKNALPKNLTVVGVDPQRQCVETAQADLTELADALGIELTFIPIHNVVEGLTEEQWGLIAQTATPRVVNASFALHHIPPYEGRDLRDETLARLRSLNPLSLILIEPNANHHTHDFMERFNNCWSHFGTTFAAIDQTEMSVDDRNAIKVCFYGREIKDILSGNEKYRSERHERAATWLERLKRSGFDPARAEPPSFLDEIEAEAGVVRPVAKSGYVGLDYDDTTILALIEAPVDPDVKPPVPETVPEVAVDLPEAFSDLESTIYLSALTAVAGADGIIDPRERAFIDYQAKLLGVDPATISAGARSIEEILTEPEELSDYTAGVIIRDLIFLAMIDEEYHADERTQIRQIAELLGYDEEVVEEAEGLVEEIVPDMLGKSPDWFRKYWYVSAKYQL